MKPPPCPHAERLDDCGTCVAALHRAAVTLARTVSMAAPDTAQPLADAELDRALAAQAGQRLLWENGIALHSDTGERCPACGTVALGRPCPSGRCPGRRVRYQPPAVTR